MKNKQEVIKASGAIQAENKMSLLERRTWTLLLANAYDDLPDEEFFSVDEKELWESLGYASRNQAHMKRILRTLMTTVVEWNLLGKDDRLEVWEASTLLAHARLAGGSITYSYSPLLRRALHNPKVFTRINLSLQARFKSKYALALWELCIDYVHATRSYGETPWIDKERFKRLVIGESELVTFQEFKNLNRKVIQPALREINEKTDYEVAVDYRKVKRVVTDLKFRIRLLPPVKELLEGNTQQSELFPDASAVTVVRELVAAGLSQIDAEVLWRQQFESVEESKRPKDSDFESYIRDKIDLLKRRQKVGKVTSATGFLLSAIKHNYTNAEAAQAAQKKQLAQQARALEAQAEQQAELERRFEAHREQVFWRRFSEQPAAWQAEQQQRLEAVLQSAPEHRFAWQSYREHGSLKAPSVAGVLMAMLEGELLSQPEETSLVAFVAWEGEA